MADVDSSCTLNASFAKHPKSQSNHSIQPALRGERERTPSNTASTPAAEKRENKHQEKEVEDIRLVEAVRTWVADCLKNCKHDDE